MPILNITHDELRNRLYHLTALNEDQRKKIFDAIEKLNGLESWYPDYFHKEMLALEKNAILSEFERKAAEKEFFPEHSW